MTKEQLDFANPDVIHNLVLSQRVPIIIGENLAARKIGLLFESPERQVIIAVPPEGTQFGDSMIGSAAFGFTFISPQGKERGRASWFTFNCCDLNALEKRIEDELKKNFPDLKRDSSATCYKL